MSYINKITKKVNSSVTDSVNIQDVRIDEFTSDDVNKVLQIDDNLNLTPVRADTLAVTKIKSGNGIMVTKTYDESDDVEKTVITHRDTSDATTKNSVQYNAIKGIGLDEFGHVTGIIQAPESVYRVNGKTDDVVLEPIDLGIDNNYKKFAPSQLPVSNPTQTALDNKADKVPTESHIASTSNPHQVTAEQVGLGGFKGYTPDTLPLSTLASARLDNLDTVVDNHKTDYDNPHRTTATQIDAVSYLSQELSEYQKSVARDNIGAGTIDDEEIKSYARLDGATFTGEVSANEPTKAVNVATKHYVDQTVVNSIGIKFNTEYQTYEALLQNIPGAENMIYLIPATLDSLINPYTFSTYEMYTWNSEQSKYVLIGVNKLDISKYTTTESLKNNYVKYTPYSSEEALTLNQKAQARTNIGASVENLYGDDLPTTDTVGLYGQEYHLRKSPYTIYQYIGSYTASVVDSFNNLPLVGDITKLYFVKVSENYYELYTWLEEVTLSYTRTGETMKISRADMINVLTDTPDELDNEWEVKTQAMIESGDIQVSYATESGSYTEHYMTEDDTVKDGDTKYLWETDSPRFQVIDHVLSASNFSVDTANSSVYILG